MEACQLARRRTEEGSGTFSCCTRIDASLQPEKVPDPFSDPVSEKVSDTFCQTRTKSLARFPSAIDVKIVLTSSQVRNCLMLPSQRRMFGYAAKSQPTSSPIETMPLPR